MSVTASIVSMAKLSAYTVTAIVCDVLFALRRSDEMEMLMADLLFALRRSDEMEMLMADLLFV